MQVYTVHEPQRPAETIEERADALVFIKEGFSLPAFLFGPFWLVAHRLWLALSGYIAAFLAIRLLMWLLPGGQGALGSVLLLASLGFGLEANTLRRWALERRGYRLIGTAAGRTFEECEHRFLTGWLARRLRPVPAIPTSAAFPSTSMPAPPRPSPL